MPPTTLSRVIANRATNAAEALPEFHGAVSVATRCDVETVVLEVRHNGTGIPAHILSKLGQQGATFGKQSGNGMGLYHARKSVEACGGKLEISSVVGEGTTVSPFLPRAPIPSWLANEIPYHGVKRWVIVDDDQAIHNVWRRRTDKMGREGAASAVHFASPADLKTWMAKTDEAREQALFLVDCEFFGRGLRRYCGRRVSPLAAAGNSRDKQI